MFRAFHQSGVVMRYAAFSRLFCHCPSAALPFIAARCANARWPAATFSDLNRDGITDLAVGAMRDQDEDFNGGGAVWILFLNPNGSADGSRRAA